MLTDEGARRRVEFVGRHTRTQERTGVGDRLRDQRAGRRDLLDLARALADDHLAVTASSASWIAAKTSSTGCSPSTITSMPASW